MDFQDRIKSALQKYTSEVELEIPPKEELGDYAFPCFEIAKDQKKSPIEVAKELSELKIKDVTIKAFGPYVNFFIAKDIFVKETLSSKVPINTSNKKIVIDYSGPNVAKHMGIHNLRSTVIGNALYQIYKYKGYKVTGVNHLGDWGTNFGQLIVAMKKYKPDIKHVKDLNDIYVKFHEEADDKLNKEARAAFKKLEEGDKEAREFFDLFVKVSLDDYNKIYDRLGITFDSLMGESEYIQYIDATFKKIKKLTEIDDGATVVQMKEGPPCLLLKSDGSTLYGMRDVTAGFYRLKEYKPDKILYVTDISQALHFKQWFEVMEKHDAKNKEIFENILFGRLSFEDGAMSTRKGKVVLLQDVLDKAKEKVLEVIKEKNPDLANQDTVAEQVGVGSIIFNDLFNDRIHNIVFSWDRVLDFQGDSGPYVQYTYARAASILRKAETKDVDFSVVTDEEFKFTKMLSQFDSVLDTCLHDNKPSHLAKYMIRIAREFNTFYGTEKIISDDANSPLRVLITTRAREVLGKGLELLGMQHPEEM